jgi:hypothetical protein
MTYMISESAVREIDNRMNVLDNLPRASENQTIDHLITIDALLIESELFEGKIEQLFPRYEIGSPVLVCS